MRNIGYEFEDRNQLDSALFWYQKALDQAQKNHNNNELVIIYTDLGIIYRKRAEYLDCKTYHELALSLAHANNDQESVGNNLHGIGYLYEQIGDYEKAVEYYLKALELSQQRGEKEGVIVTLQNISKTYMSLNIKDMALKNIEQASILAGEMRNDSVVANVLQDYGEILIHFGENEMALGKLNAALATYEKVGYERYIASSLVYIGDIFAKMGKLDLTFDFFKKALQFKDVMDAYVLADLYFKTGKLYLEKKETAEAEKNFQLSFQISGQNEFKDLQQKNAFSLYEIAKSNNKPAEALNYLQISTELKESIFNVEKTKRIAEMQLKYENEKQQRALQSLELKQYRSILFCSIALFAFIIGFLAYIARVSSRNNQLLEQKNREIQHQNIQLSESNEVLRQYAYVAAHDLKEPLRTICSFINLLELKFGQKVNDPQATEYMHLISDSAKRMNVLLTDLLEYSSIFHQKPGSDRIDPRAVLDEICINLRTLIETKNAAVEYDFPLPHLAMNRIHLVQIFQNLVGNALKFTAPDRKPSVHIVCQQEGKEVLFAVRDNGIGISETHREKIFNLFFRAVDSKQYEGTGIGLSICKSLIEKYGGRIWFQSVENQGTTFFFTFPKEMAVWQETASERLAKTA